MLNFASTENVNETIKKILTNIHSTTDQSALCKSSTSNTVSITGNTNSTIDVDKIRTFNDAKCKLAQKANALSKTDVQSKLSTLLKQEAVSTNSGFQFLNFTKAKETATTITNESTNIVSAITTSCESKSTAVNKTDISDNTNVNIHVGTIYMKNNVDSWANCAQNATNGNAVLTEIRDTISQKAKAENIGFDLNKLLSGLLNSSFTVLALVGVGILICLLGFGFISSKVIGGVAKNMATIGITVSTVLVIVFTVAALQSKSHFKKYRFTTKTIEKNCTNTVFANETHASPDSAQRSCENNSVCVGMDYNSSGKNKTTLYSNVVSGCDLTPEPSPECLSCKDSSVIGNKEATNACTTCNDKLDTMMNRESASSIKVSNRGKLFTIAGVCTIGIVVGAFVLFIEKRAEKRAV